MDEIYSSISDPSQAAPESYDSPWKEIEDVFGTS